MIRKALLVLNRRVISQPPLRDSELSFRIRGSKEPVPHLHPCCYAWRVLSPGSGHVPGGPQRRGPKIRAPPSRGVSNQHRLPEPFGVGLHPICHVQGSGGPATYGSKGPRSAPKTLGYRPQLLTLSYTGRISWGSAPGQEAGDTWPRKRRLHPLPPTTTSTLPTAAW